MAKCYRTLPTTLLELSLDDFAINAAVWRAGLEEDLRVAKKHRSRLATDDE